MAMMVALGSAVSGLKSEQTALDVIANNIANVNTTGYKSQTVSFSDILSQTLSSASASTATTGSVNAQQLGLGVAIASTTTDMTVGSTSTTSNSTDVALTGAGYFIVQNGTAGQYVFSRAGNLSVDDSGNLNINGSLVCGWQAYTLDADGNKTYNTDGAVEAININSDSYSGSKTIMAAKATTSADFTGGLDSSSTVAANATGLKSIGDTTSMDFDTKSDITVYDAQGNEYAVSVNWKKCAVEGDTTSWYWEASTTSGASITPSSGYVAFDSNGKMVNSATSLSASVDDTAGYTSSNVTVGTGVAAGTYTTTVTGKSGAYVVTLSDGTNTYTNTTTAVDGTATFAVSGGTITLTAPTAISTGTSTFTVPSTGSAATSDEANYAYSNVGIGTGVAAGNYTVTVTGTSGAYTVSLSDGTNTYTNTNSKTDGSATFATSSGTITLTKPSNLEAGTTAFTVTSTTNSFDSAPNITMTTPITAGTADVAVALDFSALTTTDLSTSTATGDADGYASGTLSSYSISKDGTLVGTYSNTLTQSLGQIALAVFDNASGLTKSGDNLYTISASSGDYDTVVAGTNGTGTMTAYALELSNVDLAAQFSSMMIAQRAYQANSKVISTSDDMLQALMAMKN